MKQLIILGLFLKLIYCLYTVAPTWITSNLVRADNKNIISSRTGNNQTPTYTFTFSSPLSGIPYLGYGIKAYQGHDYFGQEYFQVNRTYLDAGSFRVAVQIIGSTYILLMNVPYIAIDPSFPHHINSFDNVPVNYSVGVLTNISVASTTPQTYTNIINYTQQAAGLTYKTFQTPLSRNKVLLFLTSLFITGSNEQNIPPFRPINFTMKSQVYSTSQYKLDVYLSISVSVTKLHFSIVVFDEEDVVSSGVYMLVYSTINLPYTGGFIPIAAEFIDNFIMGFLDFSSNKTQTILDFQWHFMTINGTHGVFMPQSVGQTYSTLGTIQTINRITYTLFYMKTWLCPNQTFFDPAQDLCTGCPVTNCITCQNLTACILCDNANKYFLNMTTLTCQIDNSSQCGNGIVEDGELCDDGNNLSFDGCSSDCQPEIFIKCSSRISFCSSTFYIAEDSIQIKKSGCNRFQLSFKTQSVGFLSGIQQAQFINQGLVIVNREVNNKSLKIVVDYSKDIYNETLELVVPSSPFLLRVSNIEGMPLLKYQQSQCENLNYISSIVQGINIISYVGLVFSLFSSKIVGLELFGVLQLAYFSLAEHDFLNIYLSPLVALNATNGLNFVFFAQAYILPSNLRAIGVSANFMNNCNIMIILMFLLLSISYIIYRIAKKKKIKKWKKISQNLLKQGFITMVMFNIFNISFSAGIHWKYSQATDLISLLSTCVIVVTLFAIIGSVLCIQLKKQKRYGQFKDKFKYNCVCNSYIAVSIVYRMILGFYIALQNDYTQSTLLILAVSFSFIMFNVTNLPFINPLHNYRCNVIHITQLVILFCANYYRSMKLNTPMQIKGRIHQPAIIQLSMIVLCVVISVTAAVCQAGKKLKKFLKKNKIKNQHREITNHREEQSANNF